MIYHTNQMKDKNYMISIDAETAYNEIQHPFTIKTKLGMINSSQDGGVGRHTVLHHTTKRRITTNLKTNNNQN